MSKIAVKVFVKPQCPQCVATKLHLKKHKIPFEEVALDEEKATHFKEAGYSQAPIVSVSAARTGLCVDTWAGYRPDRIDALKTAVDTLEE